MWVGELDEDVAPEGERLPLVLADCTTAVRAGAAGGAATAAEEVGERALSRAAARPAGGGATLGLGREDSTGGLEAARIPFFFWRTLAMVCGALQRRIGWCVGETSCTGAAAAVCTQVRDPTSCMLIRGAPLSEVAAAGWLVARSRQLNWKHCCRTAVSGEGQGERVKE